jgi:hypothetical protein
LFDQLGTGPARQGIKNVRHSACDERVPLAIPRVPAPPAVEKENIMIPMASSTFPPQFAAPSSTAQHLGYNMLLDAPPSFSYLGSYNYDNFAPSQTTRDYFNT